MMKPVGNDKNEPLVKTKEVSTDFESRLSLLEKGVEECRNALGMKIGYKYIEKEKKDCGKNTFVKISENGLEDLLKAFFTERFPNGDITLSDVVSPFKPIEGHDVSLRVYFLLN